MNSAYYDGPVWNAFGMTYAAYAVFRRRALQSMPVEWQQRFVDLIEEFHDAMPADVADGDFSVQLREGGKFKKDPYRDYRNAGPVARLPE